MSTVSRTTATTFITLLGTIGSAATMVAKTIDSAASSVDMLDAYVQRAKDHQVKTHKIEDADWLQSLKEDAALERVKRHKQIASALPTSEDKTLFNNFVATYDALFPETAP